MGVGLPNSQGDGVSIESGTPALPESVSKSGRLVLPTTNSALTTSEF